MPPIHVPGGAVLPSSIYMDVSIACCPWYMWVALYIAWHSDAWAVYLDYLWASMPPIHVSGGAPIVHPTTPKPSSEGLM